MVTLLVPSNRKSQVAFQLTYLDFSLTNFKSQGVKVVHISTADISYSEGVKVVHISTADISYSERVKVVHISTVDIS